MLIKRKALLGPEERDDKHAVILNRLVSWVPGKGISIEADPRHAELIVHGMHLGGNDSKAVSTPGVKEDSVWQDTPLEGQRVQEHLYE
eukprot:1956137-Amphidinium_carterae.1